jgi:hypothetical protein
LRDSIQLNSASKAETTDKRVHKVETEPEGAFYKHHENGELVENWKQFKKITIFLNASNARVRINACILGLITLGHF